MSFIHFYIEQLHVSQFLNSLIGIRLVSLHFMLICVQNVYFTCFLGGGFVKKKDRDGILPNPDDLHFQ